MTNRKRRSRVNRHLSEGCSAILPSHLSFRITLVDLAHHCLIIVRNRTLKDFRGSHQTPAWSLTLDVYQALSLAINQHIVPIIWGSANQSLRFSIRLMSPGLLDCLTLWVEGNLPSFFKGQSKNLRKVKKNPNKEFSIKSSISPKMKINSLSFHKGKIQVINHH